MSAIIQIYPFEDVSHRSAILAEMYGVKVPEMKLASALRDDDPACLVLGVKNLCGVVLERMFPHGGPPDRGAMERRDLVVMGAMLLRAVELLDKREGRGPEVREPLGEWP